MIKRWSFYRNNLIRLVPKDKKILVVSPNEYEIQMYLDLGFHHITFGEYDISRLEILKKKYIHNKNINFVKIDLLDINFNDFAFDYSITQATLHHLNKPHQGLLELYRVSRYGVFIIEGNDNFIIRIASFYNFSEKFENSSVKNGKGGLMETGIPNYIYRWSEREVEKLLCSYDPQVIHNIHFEYGLDFFNQALEKNKIKNFIKFFLGIVLKVIFVFNNKIGNLFLIFIDKSKSKKRF